MVIKVRKLSSLWEKTSGLIGNETQNVYFETRWGIHTFFLKKKIIVCILDSENSVVQVKKVHPNRFFIWNPKYSRVIEIVDTTIPRERELVTLKTQKY